MEHRDEAGVVVFTSQAWRRMFILVRWSQETIDQGSGLETMAGCWIGQHPLLVSLIFEEVCRWEEERAHISGGQFVGRLAQHFGLLTMEILGGLTAPQQPPPSPPAAARTVPQRLRRLEEDVQGLRRDVGNLRGLDFNGTFRGSSPIAFKRRTRQRTGEASISTA
ncbi:hypothetical protein Tco_1382589 [Tanacetum coccineum]